MSNSENALQLHPFAETDVADVAPWLVGPGLSLPPGDGWVGRIVEDQRILALVASSRAQKVGLVRLDCGPDGAAEVTLVVAPEHRGLGLGTAIFAQALERARAGGVRRLIANVDVSNPAALAFFGAMGFESRGAAGAHIRMERLVHASGGAAMPLDVRT